jgi:hypothetical protein
VLPPVQQGVVVCALLGNALLVVTLDGVIVVAVIRGAIRSWQHRRLGPGAALRTGIGTPLSGALAATAIHWLVVQGLIRALDTGRAATWLERSERWLTGGEGDQNQGQ